MRRSGFTLLELSIVLVIIGLIIGGVTVGSELIRQAELRAVTNDITRYMTTVRTFQLKYGTIPGDLKNASSYWPNCVNIGTGGPLSTCDGNGDKDIDTDEIFLLWRQLSQSTIIPGDYRGNYDGKLRLGDNIPETTMSGVGFKVGNNDSWSPISEAYDDFQIGTYPTTPVNSSSPPLATFTPAEMLAMDQKNDDGLPHKGYFLGYGYAGSTATRSACTGIDPHTPPFPALVSYDIAQSEKLCTIFYNLFKPII